MWAVIEFCVLAAIILIAITEFFIPLLFNKPFFGSFRKVKKEEAPVQTPEGDSLSEKIERARPKEDDVKEEVNNVQEEADKRYRDAEKLKDESDNLI